MKKGSKSIRCTKCCKIIGWTIPEGKTDYGIQRVKIKLNDDGIEKSSGFCVRYYCKDCIK